MRNPLTIEAFADWLGKQNPKYDYDYNDCKACVLRLGLTTICIATG